MKAKKKVYLIGAGPGDPDLLTIKAYRLLIQAEVVLHDELFGNDILDVIPQSARLVNVGKICGDHQNQVERQDNINAMIAAEFKAGKSVIRLKTGDSLIFGRGIEEVRFLKEHAIPFELIPGVTAGIAAANIFAIPLTERLKNSAVIFCTGHTLEPGVKQFLDLVNFLKAGNPVVVYMGYNNLEKITHTLIENGISPETGVCVASKVSQKDDYVCGTIHTIHQKLIDKPLPSPTVIIIGQYVESLL
jgi:uroporphyrin-III C-methyltransferase